MEIVEGLKVEIEEVEGSEVKKEMFKLPIDSENKTLNKIEFITSHRKEIKEQRTLPELTGSRDDT